MDSLPNEILLQILENLNYEDLKSSIPRTCKRFHSLISEKTPHGKIDHLLFRDQGHISPTQSNNTASSYTVHPAFKNLSFSNEGIIHKEAKHSDDDSKTILVEFDLEELARSEVNAQGNAIAKLLPHTFLFSKKIFQQRDDIREENVVSPASSRVFILLEDLNSKYFDCRNPGSMVDVQNLPLAVFDLVAIILGVMSYHTVWMIGFDGLLRMDNTGAVTIAGPGGGGAAAGVDGLDVNNTEGSSVGKTNDRKVVYAYSWPGIIEVREAKDGVVYLSTKATCLGRRI